MIHYRKTKTYVLASYPTKSGLAVTEMYVKREFLISIDTLVLIDHKSSSTNHYHWNTLTKIWAIFLVELHDKIYGEENGMIDWFNAPKVVLQSKFALLSFIIKAFIIYHLIF